MIFFGIRLFYFLHLLLMNKKKNTSNNSTFTFKTNTGFQVLCVTFLTSIRSILELFLEFFKSDTIKLPIAYANIRV